MKRAALIILGAFAATASVPAAAQPVTHTHSTTTVTKVKGPLSVLPHHKRKYCKTRWVNHRRVRRCWYH